MYATLRKPILKPPKEKYKYIIVIDTELCDGCQLCIEFCPENVLSVSHNTNTRMLHYTEASHLENCVGCQSCERICPTAAIFVHKEPVE